MVSSLYPQHCPAQGLAQSGTRAQGTSADWMSPRIREFTKDFYTIEIMSRFRGSLCPPAKYTSPKCIYSTITEYMTHARQ